MTYKEWLVSETGSTWEELREMGMTQNQLYRLYDEYHEHCKANHISPVWDFKKQGSGTK